MTLNWAAVRSKTEYWSQIRFRINTNHKTPPDRHDGNPFSTLKVALSFFLTHSSHAHGTDLVVIPLLAAGCLWSSALALYFDYDWHSGLFGGFIDVCSRATTPATLAGKWVAKAPSRCNFQQPTCCKKALLSLPIQSPTCLLAAAPPEREMIFYSLLLFHLFARFQRWSQDQWIVR